MATDGVRGAGPLIHLARGMRVGEDGATDQPEKALPAVERLKIDLHCHTAAHSSCSSLTPEALVALARAAGLDAVCLTEHDRSWPTTDIAEIRERLDFIVLHGMEVTTELGHVLAFGLERYEPDMYIAANLRRHVLRVNGLMVLAHPARASQPELGLNLGTDLFDAVEGLNGSDGAAQNQAAMRLGARLTLPPTAGSDCHSPRETGTVATLLAHPVATERELIDELRRGQHTTLRLNAEASNQRAQPSAFDRSPATNPNGHARTLHEVRPRQPKIAPTLSGPKRMDTGDR